MNSGEKGGCGHYKPEYGNVEQTSNRTQSTDKHALNTSNTQTTLG